MARLIDVVAYDEKLFVLDMKKRVMYVGDVKDPKLCVAGSTSSGSAMRVMVAGCYDRGGAGPLIFCPKGENITGCGFGKMLREELLPFFQARGKCVGLFDNAGPHVSDVASGVFMEIGIIRVKHTARSPDFNPIELVWARMMWRVCKALPWGKHISRALFCATIKSAWAVEAQIFESDLAHVMSCMRKCVLCNGGNKY